MRDHLMGFAPASSGAIDLDDYGEMAVYCRNWVDPYPCGVPGRVLAEGEQAMCDIGNTCLAETHDQMLFRTENRPLPDGTVQHTPRQMLRFQDMLMRRIKQASETLKEQTESDLFPESHGALKRRLADAWERMGQLESQLAAYKRQQEHQQDGNARILATQMVDSMHAHRVVDDSLPQTSAGLLVGVGQGVGLAQCAAIGGAGIGVASPLGRAMAQQGSSLKP